MKTITPHEYYSLSTDEYRSFTGIVESRVIIKHFKNGLLHRADGPAVIHKQNRASNHFWINGVCFSEEEYYNHPEVIRNSEEFKDLIKYKNL